jgi:hypothetical protein
MNHSIVYFEEVDAALLMAKRFRNTIHHNEIAELEIKRRILPLYSILRFSLTIKGFPGRFLLQIHAELHKEKHPKTKGFKVLYKYIRTKHTVCWKVFCQQNLKPCTLIVNKHYFQILLLKSWHANDQDGITK